MDLLVNVGQVSPLYPYCVVNECFKFVTVMTRRIATA